MIELDAQVLGVSATLAAAAALYAVAAAASHRRGRRVRSGAIAAFASGLGALAFALAGPLDARADASLAWHMVQHLIIVGVAAPLLLLGAPLRFALGALPAVHGLRLARVLRSSLARFITQPAVAWLQFAGVLYAAHFSALYENALDHPLVHAGEHALFLVSALIFWTPLLAVAPAPHAPSHPVRLLCLFCALPMSAFLGFIFYVSRHVMYAHYGSGPAALADQAAAGTVMWVAGGFPLFAAFMWCFADWGARERRLGMLGS